MLSGFDLAALGDVKDKIRLRKELSRVNGLIDLADVKLRNNQLRDAQMTYGEINLVYRELPESCRKSVYNDLLTLGKQIDVKYLLGLITEAQNLVKYNQLERGFEAYQNVKSVYVGLDKRQKMAVKAEIAELIGLLQKAGDKRSK